jgi:pyrimidine operon attenuation protein/uracil phosphoribosyltransferase
VAPDAPTRSAATVAEPAALLDADGMRRTLTRLAHEIVEQNRGVENVVLVGIQSRGVTLANRLADAIAAFEGRRPETGALDVTMHRDDFTRAGLRQAPRPTSLPEVDGKVVVLIDDVLYTGRTIRAAMDALNDYGRPAVIRLVVLVDRGHRELPIRADLVGKNIPTTRADDVRVLLQEEDGRDAVEVVPGKVQA